MAKIVKLLLAAPLARADYSYEKQQPLLCCSWQLFNRRKAPVMREGALFKYLSAFALYCCCCGCDFADSTFVAYFLHALFGASPLPHCFSPSDAKLI